MIYTDTLYVDVSKDSLPSGKIIFDIEWDKTAIVLYSSESNPYRNTLYTIKNLELIGPGMHTGTTAIKFTNSAFIGMQNCVVTGFGTALEFSSQNWCNTFNNVNIYGNKLALNFPKPVENSGELLRFFGSTIFNNQYGVKCEYGAHINFTGCSFDYNIGRLFDLRENNNIELFGCHIEYESTAQLFDSIITLNSGWNQFKMYGGSIYVTKKDSSVSYTFIRGYSETRAVFRDVTMSNMVGPALSADVGKIVANNCKIYGRSKLPITTSWLSKSIY